MPRFYFECASIVVIVAILFSVMHKYFNKMFFVSKWWKTKVLVNTIQNVPGLSLTV